jgi:hypothetical protein
MKRRGRKKRHYKTRTKLEKPFCVIAATSVNRSWFETEAEAIEHASTLHKGSAKLEWLTRHYGGKENIPPWTMDKLKRDADGPQPTFAVVRVTAKVGSPPAPPRLVTLYK